MSDAVNSDLLKSFELDCFRRIQPNARVDDQLPSQDFAGIIVVGEAPARNEVQLLRPFVGPSGLLLDTALRLSQIDRSRIVVANVFQHRVPSNFNFPLELIQMASIDLYRRLSAYRARYGQNGKPIAVVALGVTAARALLGDRFPGSLGPIMNEVQYVERDGETWAIIPTLHPASLLRGGGGNNVEFEEKAEILFWHIVISLTRAKRVIKGEEVPPPVEFEQAKSIDDVRNFLDRHDTFAFDIEGTSVSPVSTGIVCFALAASNTEALSVPSDLIGGVSFQAFVDLLNERKDRVKLIIHNAMYDYAVLRRFGFKGRFHFDTMFGSRPLHEYLPEDLKTLGQLYNKIPRVEFKFGSQFDPSKLSPETLDLLLTYNVIDAVNTIMLFKRFQDDYGPRERRIFNEYVHPLIHELVSMSLEGLTLDFDACNSLESRLTSELQALEKELKSELGTPEDYELNLRSSSQILKLLRARKPELYSRLPLTAKGNPSLSKTVLKKLADEGVRFAQLLREYRAKNKLLTSYVQPFKTLAAQEGGRLHTEYGFTRTFRLASRRPALQTLPRKSEILRLIKASDGTHFLKVDLSAAEARVFAFLAGEERLLDSKMDIHRVCASIFFGVPIEQVTPEMRQFSKNFFFGLIYGASPMLIASRLGISPDEARRRFDEFFSKFPKLRQYMKEIEDHLRRYGYVENIIGVRRHFFLELVAYSVDPQRGRSLFHKAIRESYNHPTQSTVAYITNRTLIKTRRELPKIDAQARTAHQIHDELVFEIPVGKPDKAIKCFETIWDLFHEPIVHPKDPSKKLVIPIEAKAGYNLLDCEEICGLRVEKEEAIERYEQWYHEHAV